jgi:hypothetical protein
MNMTTEPLNNAILRRLTVLENVVHNLKQPNEPVEPYCYATKNPSTGEIYISTFKNNAFGYIPLYTAQPELEQVNKFLEAKCKELMEKLHESASNFVEFIQIDHPKALGERDAQIAELEVILRDRDSELEIEYAQIADLTAKLEKMKWALKHVKPSTRNVDQNAWETIEQALEGCKS